MNDDSDLPDSGGTPWSAPLKPAQEVVSLATELVKLGKDNPDARSAAASASRSANVVAETLETVLWPIAALNSGRKKAQQYFASKFENDLRDRTSKIKEENLIEPKVSIAGPAMQGIAYSVDEPEIRDLYVELIATAMDIGKQSDAHPAFVEVISQMNAEEAILFEVFVGQIEGRYAPIARPTVKSPEYKTSTIQVLITKFSDSAQFDRTVDNWARLGLAMVDFNQNFNSADAYDFVENTAKWKEVYRVNAHHLDGNNTMVPQKGVLYLTDFGDSFARAVGLQRAGK